MSIMIRSIAVLLLCISQVSHGSELLLFSYSYTLPQDPLYGVRLESAVPAVDLALDYINNNSSLLPGYNLTYNSIKSLKCDSNQSWEVASDPDFGILGDSCAEGTPQPLPGTLQVIFTPSSPANLAGGNGSIFRVHPTPDTYAQAVTGFVEQFGWKRLSVLTSEGSFFSKVMESIIKINRTKLIDPPKNLSNIVQFPQDVRIFFLNMNTVQATRIMCQAYLSRLLFPRYVWITYTGDFNSTLSNLQGIECNRQQIEQFLDGVFMLEPTFGVQNSSLIAVQQDLIEIYGSNGRETSLPLAHFAFDAVLALSTALNDSLGDDDDDDDDGTSGGPLLHSVLQNTTINGLTGLISFDSSGNRIENILGVSQFRNEDSGSLKAELIARITVSTIKGSQFNFKMGENAHTIFRGPIPHDGTPEKRPQTQPIPLIVIYYIIATLGVICAIICLIFTIVFRKRKVIKSTSPNLNYFIIIGAIIIFSSVYVRLLPYRSTFFNRFLCTYQILATIFGYSLLFAPILMKSFRVCYIFHDPKPGKKALKDWHLVVGMFIIIGILMFIALLGLVIPPLRPNPVFVRDRERPTGVTADGITIYFCSFECHSTPASFAWLAVELVFLAMIQLAAFILVLATRKVKIKAFNDFRETTAIIYTTSIIMVVLAGVTFGLSSFIIVTEVLFSGGLMLGSYVVLFCIFGIKMIGLYRDPKGEKIFPTSIDTGDRSRVNSSVSQRFNLSTTISTRLGSLSPAPSHPHLHESSPTRNTVTTSSPIIPLRKNGTPSSDIFLDISSAVHNDSKFEEDNDHKDGVSFPINLQQNYEEHDSPTGGD